VRAACLGRDPRSRDKIPARSVIGNRASGDRCRPTRDSRDGGEIIGARGHGASLAGLMGVGRPGRIAAATGSIALVFAIVWSAVTFLT